MSVCICKYVDFKNYSHLYLIQKIYNNKTQITHTHTHYAMLKYKKILSLSHSLTLSLLVLWKMCYIFTVFFYFIIILFLVIRCCF